MTYILTSERVVLSVTVVAVVGVTYWLGWCVYSLWLHPLAKYRGPRLAAISEIWLARVWLSGRYPAVIEEAHRRYGDVIRIAPNELSFATVQAHKDIYSTPSRTRKPFLKYGKFYNNGDVRTLFYELNPVEHARQRRILAPEFSASALKVQEHVFHQYVDLFVRKMGELGARSETMASGINVTDAMQWLGFDIMGELTFGESFNAVATAKTHFWISLLRDSAHAAVLPSLAQRLPLLRPFLPFMVSISAIKNLKRHYAFTLETVHRRIQRSFSLAASSTPSSPHDKSLESLVTGTAGEQREDLFASLLKYGNMSETQLVSVSQALIIAGADTVSHVLTAAMYYLCTHKSAFARLSDEIRALEYDDLKGTNLGHLPYLNAVIEETMRCIPPIAFGLPRVSPGDVIDGQPIPAGIVVSAPHWAILRNPRTCARPSEFDPGRWIAATSATGNDVRSKNAECGSAESVLPRGLAFSTGPRSCLGISQAYLQLRIALAKLVHTYDFQLAQDPGDWIGEAEMYMLWKEKPLFVHFRPRAWNDD